MKRKLFICLLFMLFILPYNVLAEESSGQANINITCPATAKAGDIISCSISGNSNVEIIDISAKIELDDNASISSFELNDIWEGNDISDSKIDIFTKSGDPISSNFDIGTLKIKIKDGIVNTNVSVSLTSIVFSYYSKEYNVSDNSTKVRIPNNVNTLTSLTVSGATFTFKESTTSYNIELDAESTTISATKKDENSVVSGDTGTKSLKYGMNTFTITVTAEDGSKKNYTLNITRPDKRSKENDLIAFEFNGNDIKFNKNKTEYSLELENIVSRIGFCDKDSKKINMLCIDEEIIEVSDKANSRIYLNEINLDEKYIETNKKIIKDCNDDKCVNYLDKEVVGKSNGEKEEWYIPVSELKVGKNVLKAVVTAENEAEKTYTFNINRKDEKGDLIDEELSSDGNGKTGDVLIIFVSLMALLSIIGMLYFIKKNKQII